MPRFKLRTLLIVLAMGPMVLVGCVDSPTQTKPPPGFYDKVRIPFPPDIRRVLDAPDSFTLFSIEGEDDIKPEVTEQSFHGFNILGKTGIEDPQQRKSLVDALDEGISTVTHGPALCFAPRHGIRVVQGDTQLDLVICFECAQIYVLNEKGLVIFGTHTTEAPSVVFNQALSSAKVPLATPPSR
jgi:hypothetical protein